MNWKIHFASGSNPFFILDVRKFSFFFCCFALTSVCSIPRWIGKIFGRQLLMIWMHLDGGCMCIFGWYFIHIHWIRLYSRSTFLKWNSSSKLFQKRKKSLENVQWEIERDGKKMKRATKRIMSYDSLDYFGEMKKNVLLSMGAQQTKGVKSEICLIRVFRGFHGKSSSLMKCFFSFIFWNFTYVNANIRACTK